MSYADTFFSAYLTAALWTSEEELGDHSESDIDVDSLVKMRTECTLFLQSAEVSACLNESGLSAESAGHDFWLTRNRHGAGFWDRGLGEVGNRLTKLAHAAGERMLYVGDDNQIHMGW